MAQAVRNLSVRPTRLLVDAMQVPVPIEQTRLIKGDAKSASISAASIVAKVVRDHLMTMYDQVYPGYDFLIIWATGLLSIWPGWPVSALRRFIANLFHRFEMLSGSKSVTTL